MTTLEALYKKVHTEIRKNPKAVKAERKQAAVRKVISKDRTAIVYEDSKKRKYIRHKKMNKDERKKRVAAKIQKAISKK